MKLYKIIDGQGAGTHYDEVFKNKEEIKEHLASYHSLDWEGEEEIEKLSLEELMDYGEWDIEEVEGILCPLCGEPIEHHNHKKADLWACNSCPFVGFEFYGNDNLQDLINYLNK